jgi:glutamate transport system substrate-binding protein
MKESSMIPASRRLRLGAVICLPVLGLLAPACTSDDGKATEGSSRSAERSIFDEPSVQIEVMKGLPGFSTRAEYEYAGFDIDLANFLAEEMDFEKTAHDVRPEDREWRLVKADADLAVAAYTITKARDEEIDFTAPYLKTYQGILVRKDDAEIHTTEDLEDKDVCTAAGSTSDPRAAKKKDQLRKALGVDTRIGTRPDHKTCVKELQKKNYDAVWTDRVLLEGFAQTAPYSENVKVVEDISIENVQYYGIGIREGHEEDCEKINEKIEQFLVKGWRDRFEDHFEDIVEKNSSSIEQKYKPTQAEFESQRANSCGRAD